MLELTRLSDIFHAAQAALTRSPHDFATVERAIRECQARPGFGGVPGLSVRFGVDDGFMWLDVTSRHHQDGFRWCDRLPEPQPEAASPVPWWETAQ